MKIEQIVIGTGYWATETHSTKVHFSRFGRPLCGSKVKGKYQWCSQYPVIKYVECKHCKKKIQKIFDLFP